MSTSCEDPAILNVGQGVTRYTIKIIYCEPLALLNYPQAGPSLSFSIISCNIVNIETLDIEVLHVSVLYVSHQPLLLLKGSKAQIMNYGNLLQINL